MPYRKVSRCHPDLVAIIFKVAERLHLKDIDYVIEFGCDDIDSFLNGLFRIQIKGYFDGQKVHQSVILKYHTEAKQRNKFKDFYLREYAFVEHVVPELLDIQKRFKVIEGLKIKFPNCIYSSEVHGKETIVVLAFFPPGSNGFGQLGRFEKTDFAHASLVVKYLAKLHALSFVLQETNPGVFNNIRKFYDKDVQYSERHRVSKSIETCYMSSVSVVSNTVAKAQLKELAPDVMHVLHKCTLPASHSAICHGDCWNNNVMFKYVQGRRPVDNILIDYQISRLASPVTDLSYYFYMSTERDFLHKHYDQLLNIYYGTLTAVLRYCDLDISDIYPKNVFERHLKIYSVLGLVEALIAMKIITADYDTASEMVEKKSCDETKIFESPPQNEFYVDRVNGIVDDFFSREYSLRAVLNQTA